ncbi:MAG: N-acetylmuramoyl-L-alanine amidase [Robiginitomaculum sp.]|nr:MAG: N-acetylmuramoyl-L-alanine amidase [Robiginitomaculum sp.]
MPSHWGTIMNISKAISHRKATTLYCAMALFGLIALAACGTTKKEVFIPSENTNGRVSILVIHHTSSNFEDSVNILTKASSRPVSSHYLIPDPSDETYTRKTLEVYKLVPETQRAWHAGRSYWAGKSGLNDQSIGIEVVNQTYCTKGNTEPQSMEKSDTPKRICFYPDFPETQMEVLIRLVQDILNRHPDIKPINIIGHSDIAPARKVDPGPRFPWQRLYKLGIGAWFDDDSAVKYWEQFRQTPMPLINIQKALGVYGYKIEATGKLDEQTHDVLRAFQLHFRPMAVTGTPDLDSTAILFALIEKYRPNRLSDLLVVELEPELELEPESEQETQETQP